MNHQSENGYGLRFFDPKTPGKEKSIKIIFFFVFCGLILAQAFFWVVGNSVTPFILGMPFSLFVVVLLIVAEFFALLALYNYEKKSLDT